MHLADTLKHPMKYMESKGVKSIDHFAQYKCQYRSSLSTSLHKIILTKLSSPTTQVTYFPMADRWASIHQNPSGPGDSRPTAKQIVEAEGLQGQWKGRTILITGCSSGLGVEAAKALAETGATLYLTARNPRKAEKALGDLVKLPQVHLLQLDLNSLADVRRCAEEFLGQCSRLNVFIANAGVMACPEGRTEDGFETQCGTNHLAHFLLLQLLTPALVAAATPTLHSRVVILSSIAHRFGSVNFENYNLEGIYDPSLAYSQSKTANLWTALAYNRKMKTHNIDAWAVQPGGVATGLMQHLDADTKNLLEQNPYLQKIFKSPEQGAATEVWAACSEALEGRGGEYLEDCQVIGPYREGTDVFAAGFATHALDEEGQERLFELSRKLTGIN
jgi:NAD(P)-dependent dehydrogenase (short-subunit alcohol dehydrogenase family)